MVCIIQIIDRDKVYMSCLVYNYYTSITKGLVGVLIWHY